MFQKTVAKEMTPVGCWTCIRTCNHLLTLEYIHAKPFCLAGQLEPPRVLVSMNMVQKRFFAFQIIRTLYQYVRPMLRLVVLLSQLRITYTAYSMYM